MFYNIKFLEFWQCLKILTLFSTMVTKYWWPWYTRGTRGWEPSLHYWYHNCQKYFNFNFNPFFANNKSAACDTHIDFAFIISRHHNCFTKLISIGWFLIFRYKHLYQQVSKYHNTKNCVVALLSLETISFFFLFIYTGFQSCLLRVVKGLGMCNSDLSMSTWNAWMRSRCIFLKKKKNLSKFQTFPYTANFPTAKIWGLDTILAL